MHFIMSERITENLVRELLKSKGYFSNKNITVEEQSSRFENINELLKTSSKSGKDNKGFPEFIISSTDIVFTLGFAMTIHLCQSKTFPGINIYIKKKHILDNRATYIRLIYVALSRVRDFHNCYIHIT